MLKKLTHAVCGGAMLLLVACGAGMQAEMKIAQGNYAEAIPLYEKALQSDPDSVNHGNKLGFAYLKTNQLDQAIEQFDRILDKDPQNSYAILYQGMAYLNKKDFDKTLALWQNFKDDEKPVVEQEINRLMTIVMMAQNQRTARQALQTEEKLANIDLDTSTIAVVPFIDLTEDHSLQAFSKALAAMITTDLTKINQLKVLERGQIQALLNEMKLGQSGIVDEKTAPRIGRLLKAENVVVGNLSKGSIQTTLSLATASAGDTKGSVSAKVDVDKFYELPSLLVQNVAKIMQIQLGEAELAAITTPHTKNFKAMVHYGSALNALDEGNWEKAQDFFALAIKEDPIFMLARSGRDSSPGRSAPSVEAIQSADPSENSVFLEAIETSIKTATEAQQAADEAAKEASTSGGGGGGGGGSSH
nr:tetratricopeptide repeat protein [Desulfobulbaceae bacterium]